MGSKKAKGRRRAALVESDGAQVAEHPPEKRREFLTARQLAEILQVSESTIHRLRRAGRIPAVMVTEKLIRFNLREVTRALTPKHASHDGEPEPEELPSPQLSFKDVDGDFGI